MAKIIKGKDVAAKIKEQISKDLKKLDGVKPILAIVRIGENASDVSYERGTVKTCEEAGIECKVFAYPEDISMDDFVREFKGINENKDIDGILVFRPMPSQIDEKAICNLIDPEKDMDCMSPVNQAKVFLGDDSGYAPCTAEAVMEMIDYSGVEIAGANAVVIGRSEVIGKPVSFMLLKKNATVSICHSHTKDIKKLIDDADIVLCAVGKAGFLTEDMVKDSKDLSVFDVGINFENGKMCGDVAYDEVLPYCKNITPVPGGVGGVTNVVLSSHVVKAALKKH